MATNSGNKGRTTFSILVLATPTPTKSTEPTGGVHRPIQRFNIIIIPKCTGSIPRAVTTGRKIGVKMSTAGVKSIKTPTTNSIMFIIRSTIIVLSLIPKRRLLIS